MAGKISIRTGMGSRYNRAYHTAGMRNLQKQFRQNMGEILGALNDFVKGVNEITPEVLADAMEETFGKALEYTPVDSGKLRESGYLETRSYHGRHIVAIGFGKGGKPSYAIYVHELPYAHEAPTRSKFLEAALDEDYYAILNKIPRLMRERAGT